MGMSPPMERMSRALSRASVRETMCSLPSEMNVAGIHGSVRKSNDGVCGIGASFFGYEDTRHDEICQTLNMPNIVQTKRT